MRVNISPQDEDGLSKVFFCLHIYMKGINLDLANMYSGSKSNVVLLKFFVLNSNTVLLKPSVYHRQGGNSL